MKSYVLPLKKKSLVKHLTIDEIHAANKAWEDNLRRAHKKFKADRQRDLANIKKQLSA